jgi:GT2 family glycosyltransferase
VTPPQAHPKVSVIIVNHNGCEYTRSCVASVLACRFDSFEVIVVDNGSSEGSARRLREEFGERLTLVELDQNYGPARARNEGVQRSRGEFIGFLDNDTTVDPEYMAEAVRAFEASPGLGILQCKLLLMDTPDCIDYVGEYIGTNGFLVQIAPAGTRDQGQFNAAYPILAAKSAGMFIRRAAFDAAGGFDEEYFIYVEETDLGWRTWLMGYTVQFAPGSIVYHKFGTSSVILGKSRNDYNAKFHGTKNYILTLLKNLETVGLLRILPIHVSLWLGLAWFSLLQGRGNYFLWIHKAMLWHLANLPRTLSKRRVVQQARRVSDSELFGPLMQRKPFSYYLGKVISRHKIGNVEGFFKS